MSDALGGALLAFEVGAVRAALPLGLVREIVDCPPIVPVPGCHPHVAGVTLSGGIALPVYDLRRFPAFWESQSAAVGSGRASQPRHLIVVGYGEVMVALLGAQADLLDRLEPDDSDAAGEGVIRREFIKGMLKSGALSVALLDPERLFASLGVPADGVRNAREDEGEEDPAGR